MKILFVDRPHQDAQTLKPYLINGRIYHWTVTSERIQINTTFQEWLQEKIKWADEKKLVEAILIYDMMPVVLSETQSAMIIRYAWLEKL
jgi:hypothetical protein